MNLKINLGFPPCVLQFLNLLGINSRFDVQLSRACSDAISRPYDLSEILPSSLRYTLLKDSIVFANLSLLLSWLVLPVRSPSVVLLLVNCFLRWLFLQTTAGIRPEEFLLFLWEVDPPFRPFQFLGNLGSTEEQILIE